MINKPGAAPDRSAMLTDALFSSIAALTAVIATGVVCKVSERRRAVTMISLPSPTVLVAGSSCPAIGCGAVCAIAMVGKNCIPVPASRTRIARFEAPPFIGKPPLLARGIASLFLHTTYARGAQRTYCNKS
ncbi:hypothetical protein D9M73_134250 [compost metagenome]